jgi:hypothetical protein
MTMGRAINGDFLEALKTGEHKNIVDLVRKDTSLSLQFRGTKVTIYYKSCRILEINPSGKNPYDISQEYKCPIIPNKSTEWREYFMSAKTAIDEYPGNSFEGDIKQRIVHENNFSSISNGTDYFIVDTEYTESGFGGRFDAVAAFWPRERRRNSKDLKLALIEVKAGEGAISGSSGIIDHLKDAKDFLSSDRKSEFVLDMGKVFTQLRDLNLVRFGPESNPRPVSFSKTEFQFIFVLADYNQNSTKLQTALEGLKDEDLPFELRFATSSFMGYGLYKECMLTLTQFSKLLKIEERTE